MNAISDSLPVIDDPQIVRALEEYAEAREDGRRPSREEILARYADSAGVLAKCIDALDFVRSAAPQLQTPDAEELALESSVPLGDYRIEREIGRGGMGVVYEAQQLSLGRRVALKVLPFAATMDKRQLQRFQNEARAAASLEHPHIVPVYGVGCERGVHYYAMRFIEGQPLDAILKQLRDEKQPAAPTPPSSPDPETGATVAHSDSGPVVASDNRLATETLGELRGLASTLLSHGSKKETVRRIADLARQAADALDHAHQSGVIHRDIKPANLLIDDDGQLWITDFGLAQIQTDTRLTMTGDLVGTLRYMSPEQALAKRVIVDHRTDIYSLGATFYEVLTLTPVFGGQDRQELLRQIAFDEPIAPRRLNRQIPAELETVILKALEKNPAERYGTAREMVEDLKRYLNDEPTLAKRPTLLHRAKKWSRRHVAAVRATVAVLLVTVTVVAATGGWWLRDRSARELETEKAVTTSLEEATQLQAARNVPGALAKVKQAKAILDGGASTVNLEQRVAARLADLELITNLEEIRSERVTRMTAEIDYPQFASKYVQVFRTGGLDLLSLAPEEAMRRIRARSVAVELAAALDDWSFVVSKTDPVDNALRKRLLRLAQAADPDAVRDKIRDAMERDDLSALKDLAVHLNVHEVSAATVVACAYALTGKAAYKEAVELLRKIQLRHSSDYFVNDYLAWSLMQCDPPQYEEAIRYFTAALAVRSDSSPTYLRLGKTLSDYGRHEDSVAATRQSIYLRPDYASAHFNLGKALADNKQYDEAIAAYRQAIRLEPDQVNAHNNLGILLLEIGRIDEAIAVDRELIRLKPDHTMGYMNLGGSLLKRGQLEESMAAVRKAISLNPNLARAHYSLGNVLSKQAKWEEAIAAYSEAIRIEPDFSNAQHNLGAAFANKGEVNKGIEYFRKAIHLEPGYAPAHYNLGKALESQAKWDEAIAAYRKAIGAKPEYRDAHINLGNILVKNGDVNEGIEHIRKAVHLEPSYATAHFKLGWALGLQEKWDEAIAAYRKAIRLNPNYSLARNNLAWILANSANPLFRNHKEAVLHAKKAVEKSPTSSMYLNTLGVAHYRNCDWKDGVVALNNSIKLGKGDNSLNFFFLGMAHWHLGDKDEALSWHTKGVDWMNKNRPNDAELERVRAESAALLGVKDANMKGKKALVVCRV